MKILIYLDSMAPAGGIERVVSKHIDFFKIKNEVTLVTKDDKESFYDLPSSLVVKSLSVDNRMNMNNKFKRIYQSLYQLISVKNKLNRFKDKYDLYYVTHVRNLLELYLAGINIQKVIVTEHGSYFAYNKVYKKLKQFLYPKCRYIISPTTMDYKIYEKEGCNSKYIPNPLSFYNEEYSLLTNKTVLNIGRLTEDKRQKLLLKIWSKIIIKNPDWKLKIIGHGELKNDLEETIKILKIENSAEIIEPIKNIENVYLNSSIFAFTSKYEGFGMVLAEAMAYGIPCVSFNVPSGPRDIIEDNIDGFLIEDNNMEDYTSKLEFMMTSNEKREKMGKNAKQNIQKFLDVKIEKKWNKLLNEGFLNEI